MSRRGAATFALLCVALAPWSAAHASGGDDDATIPVHVTAKLADGCPSERSVFDRIHARIERVHEVPVAESDAVDVTIQVIRERATTRGTLTVALGESRTVRTVSASSCEEALSALVVMTAVALDAIVPIPTPTPSQPEKTTPKARPPTTTPTKWKTVAEPRRRTAGRASFASGASLELHDLGSAVVVPSLFVELSFAAPLRPSLRLAMARSVGAEFATPSGSAAFAWLYATARECVELGREALTFGPCVSASVGTLDVHTLPPTYPASLQRLWFTLGVAARMAWRPVRALSVELTAGLATPLRRDELYFEPRVTVYRTPVLMPFAGVGLLFHVR